jgi:hypothetical protein
MSPIPTADTDAELTPVPFVYVTVPEIEYSGVVKLTPLTLEPLLILTLLEEGEKLKPLFDALTEYEPLGTPGI